MTRQELLRRIEEGLRRRGWSDYRASNVAGLKGDFIRNLRRFPASGVKVEKLIALARVFDFPPAYLTDELVELSEAVRPAALDRVLLRQAQNAADRAIEGQQIKDCDQVRANLTADVYDVLAERARAGKPVSGPEADAFIEGFIKGSTSSVMPGPRVRAERGPRTSLVPGIHAPAVEAGSRFGRVDGRVKPSHDDDGAYDQ